MPRANLKVELLSYSLGGENLPVLAAKLCYAKSDIAQLKQKIEAQDQEKFLNMILQSGHLSVTEHISFTFGVEGVSRALLAQLTRHRLASFSVQSQRYVSYENGFNYIIPPAIASLGDEAVKAFEEQMSTIHSWYKAWQEKLEKGEKGNEDARFVLPNACETRLVVTMNARELMHFCSLRCCNRAQWEIHALADEMLKLAREKAPIIFRKAGPGCVRGACTEGAKACGKMKEVRAKYLEE